MMIPSDRLDPRLIPIDNIIKTLKDLRGAVLSKGKALFATERSRAKSAVARRVREEMVIGKSCPR